MASLAFLSISGVKEWAKMVVFQKYDLRFKTKSYLFGHKSSEESESSSYFSTKSFSSNLHLSRTRFARWIFQVLNLVTCVQRLLQVGVACSIISWSTAEKSHMKTHTGERLFKCNKCNTWKYQLTKHLQTHMTSDWMVHLYSKSPIDQTFAYSHDLRLWGSE